jgi:hypothetical protein
LNPIFARAAVGLVVALGVAGAVNYHIDADALNRPYADPWATRIIATDQERFRGVVATVPEEAVVGYVSDLPNHRSGAILKADAWTIGVFSAAAWYALAPRLVIPDAEPQTQDWIVGNFSRPVDLARIESENRIRMVRDFGSGVVLFKGR